MHMIIDILMIVVFVMQIIVLSYLLYVNHKRYKLSLTQQQKIFDLVKENQLGEQRKQDESL